MLKQSKGLYSVLSNHVFKSIFADKDLRKGHRVTSTPRAGKTRTGACGQERPVATGRDQLQLAPARRCWPERAERAAKTPQDWSERTPPTKVTTPRPASRNWPRPVATGRGQKVLVAASDHWPSRCLYETSSCI
jgi:hypothetical protein